MNDRVEDELLLSLREIALPQASLSTMNQRRLFSYKSETEHAYGTISLFDCWMNEHEYILYCYECTSLQREESKNNLYFEYNHQVFSLACPLYFHINKVKTRIQKVLVSKAILVDEKDIEISCGGTILNNSLSLQSYGVNDHATLMVSLLKESEFVFDPLIMEENSFFRRDVTFVFEEDIDEFVGFVNQNAFFPVTHLTFHFGSYNGYELSTTLDQLLSMLHSSFLPNVIVLSFVYNAFGMDEPWSTCFLSPTFPNLKRVAVYQLNDEGYVMTRNENIQMQMETEETPPETFFQPVETMNEPEVEKEEQVVKKTVINKKTFEIVHSTKKEYTSFVFKSKDKERDYFFKENEKGTPTMVSCGGKSFSVKVNYNLLYKELVPYLIRVII